MRGSGETTVSHSLLDLKVIDRLLLYTRLENYSQIQKFLWDHIKSMMALKNDPLIEPLMKNDFRRNRIPYKEPFVPYSTIEWESFFINLLKQYRLSYKLFDEFKKEDHKTNESIIKMSGISFLRGIL